MNYYTGDVISNNIKVPMYLMDEFSTTSSLCERNAGERGSVQTVLKAKLIIFLSCVPISGDPLQH